MTRHPVDPISLVFGLVFVLLGNVFLANPAGVDGALLGVLLPVAAVAAGVGIAWSLLRRG